MALDPLEWAGLLLLAWALLVWTPVPTRKLSGLSTVRTGLLRGGRRAAVRTAVTELFLGGLVEVRRNGALARGAGSMRTGGDPVVRAVYATLTTPTWFRLLPGRPRVRQAMADSVRRLATAGLIPGRLRWPLARLLLLVLAVKSIVHLIRALPGYADLWPHGAALVAAMLAWLVPRRTVLGHLRLWSLRRRMKASGAGESDTPSARPVMKIALSGAVPAGLKPAFARRRLPSAFRDHPTGSGESHGLADSGLP